MTKIQSLTPCFNKNITETAHSALSNTHGFPNTSATSTCSWIVKISLQHRVVLKAVVSSPPLSQPHTHSEYAVGCFRGWQSSRRERCTYVMGDSQLSVQQVTSRCKNIVLLPSSSISSVTFFTPPTCSTDSFQTFIKIKMNICHVLEGTFAHGSSIKHAKIPNLQLYQYI